MPILRTTFARIVQHEDINFLLTNRIPRRMATRFFGWFSQIENPWVRDISIAIWRAFADLDLTDAEDTKFRSLHHCFTRRLKAGARPVDLDAAILVSPCDAIIGAFGLITEGRVIQVKGFPYSLQDLLDDSAHAGQYEGGTFVTLRLTSSMYHRFHAPHDCQVESITYLSGDTWNVNPIALKRVEQLFCKNERAIIRAKLSETGFAITLVPVAAILVASIRLGFLDAILDLRADGPRRVACNVRLRKGDEMGWFQHGSTIIVFAPRGFGFCDGIVDGATIRAGQALLKLPSTELV
ncbi:phosphatidylserine decarboxylase [Belnapia sp. T18]|uniref:phosphatidylserine decarboxylase n=1 Tax=Belnapia arida TaxID=2804533 RepID=A0ABS1UH60_9PROT|nr:archaetidylserine decarboxylase [Belnapia arida]MBL6082616.1 phosphatidylserine decarboxylase [Belnapia arida]